MHGHKVLKVLHFLSAIYFECGDHNEYYGLPIAMTYNTVLVRCYRYLRKHPRYTLYPQFKYFIILAQ